MHMVIRLLIWGFEHVCYEGFIKPQNKFNKHYLFCYRRSVLHEYGEKYEERSRLWFQYYATAARWAHTVLRVMSKLVIMKIDRNEGNHGN